MRSQIPSLNCLPPIKNNLFPYTTEVGPYHQLVYNISLERYGSEKRTKILLVKPSIWEWGVKFYNMRAQIFTPRICTGDSRMTHNHYMNADLGPFASPLPLCHQLAISVCNELAGARLVLLNLPFTLQSSLTDPIYRKNPIAFSKHTGLYKAVQILNSSTNEKNLPPHNALQHMNGRA